MFIEGNYDVKKDIVKFSLSNIYMEGKEIQSVKYYLGFEMFKIAVNFDDLKVWLEIIENVRTSFTNFV